ncbi:MAG TPA: nuclear transport factor 2 family protein [Steroidobacteraceae bacterium]|nr:nuclear transport factor 2 family protein [Steroidobacteraceae bacterium]
MRLISAVVACAILCTACMQPQMPDPAALGREILAAEAAEAAAWARRDVESVMNAYAPEAQVLLGGAPIDREQLRKLFVKFLEDPAFALTFRSDPPLMAASGDLGITIGTYQVTTTDPATNLPVTRHGHHLMSWRLQEDGQWRVIRQMTRHDN